MPLRSRCTARLVERSQTWTRSCTIQKNNRRKAFTTWPSIKDKSKNYYGISGRGSGHSNRHRANLNDKDVIITTSLEKTLLAHRNANAEALESQEEAGDESPGERTPSVRFIPTKYQQISDTHERGQREVDSRRLILQRSDEQWDDYTGEVFEPQFDWTILGDIPRYLRYPWMRHLDQAGTVPTESSQDRLHAEIHAADTFLQPSPEELAVADKAKRSIETMMTRIWKIKQLDTIGSRATGFASPTSDIDLNIVLRLRTEPLIEKSVKDPTVNILHVLFRELKHVAPSPDLSLNFLAATAKVPVISAFHVPTQLEVQIQCAETGYGSMEVQKALAAQIPNLRPLFRIIKHMLQMRGLASSKSRAMTSYPLIIMIETALRIGGLDGKDSDAGAQLLHVLEFWGKFDTYTVGITHVPAPQFGVPAAELFKNDTEALKCIDLVTQDPIGAIPIPFAARRRIPHLHKRLSNAHDTYRLILHDPANPYNDLGFSNKYIKHIQATFLDLHAKLKKSMSEWDAGIRANTLTDRPPALLAPMLEGDYSLYNLNRKKLLSWDGMPTDTPLPDQRLMDMAASGEPAAGSDLVITRRGRTNKNDRRRSLMNPAKQQSLEEMEEAENIIKHNAPPFRTG